MESSEIYTSMIQPRGAAYRESQIVSWSHYNDAIDRSSGRPAGNSRIWGDASPEAQSRVIDALIASSERAGLNPRQTAYVLATARLESGFNVDAAAGTTSATGLGQFIDKTGASYGINDGNRNDLRMQADALVAHYQENAALANARGQGEDYIYKYHHDGPSGEYGGLALAQKDVLPYLDRYETFVREHEKQYGIAERGPSFAQHHDASHNTHTNHLTGARGRLEEGAEGKPTQDLQNKLAKLGYLSKDQVDGKFGLDTRHAVERFQDDHAPLIVDGKVGKNTSDTLDAVVKVHDKANEPITTALAGEKGLLLSNSLNADHALFEQALAGVHSLPARGQPTEQQRSNLAGALVVEAKQQGFSRIDQVALGNSGNRVYIAQQPASLTEQTKLGSVDTVTALQTPISQSSATVAAITPTSPTVATPAPAVQEATINHAQTR
jgi:peptidoglycan hydrolase-like protein with peptidoglycan-binding domain